MATRAGYSPVIAIFVCTFLQFITCQRPMLNSSTSASTGIGSPAPSFMPTPRTRSDVAQMVYKPSPPDSNGGSNSRAGKFSELKNQMRKNNTHFNTHANNFHDAAYMRVHTKASSIDRLRKYNAANRTQSVQPLHDTPNFPLYDKDPIKSLKENFRQQVIQFAYYHLAQIAVAPDKPVPIQFHRK